MRKIIIILIGLLAYIKTSYCQTINIQAGETLSKLNWVFETNPYGYIQDGYIQTYHGKSVFVGIDYLDHQFFNLSSNIGFLQTGGQSVAMFYVSSGDLVREVGINAYLNYLSFNTSLEIKYPFKFKLTPFLNIGPRIDFLVSKNISNSSLTNLSPVSTGLILGGGIKYNFGRY